MYIACVSQTGMHIVTVGIAGPTCVQSFTLVTFQITYTCDSYVYHPRLPIKCIVLQLYILMCSKMYCLIHE